MLDEWLLKEKKKRKKNKEIMNSDIMRDIFYNCITYIPVISR